MNYRRIIFYIDMDGVLAMWEENVSEEETHEKGHFLNKEAEESAVGLVRMLKDAGEDVRIMSSVYRDDHSGMDKHMWLNEAGLQDIPRIFVPYGDDKHAYIEDDDALAVLIDDYGKNLRAWEADGNLAIKFMNGINNRPKLTIANGIVHVKQDTWTGYSIDRRMSPRQMYLLVTSIAYAVAAEGGAA